MITPPYLKKGDKVGIVAPARYIPQEKYPQIMQLIEWNGWVPVRGKTTFVETGFFAGTDAVRLEDLQYMLDSDDIKALFCLRGGYGTIRILEGLNFDKFVHNPKWLVGFSDITLLHAALTKLSIESIHGQMPINFNNNSPALENLFQTLRGNTKDYFIEPHELNRFGMANAPVVGGNVALICALLGTRYALETKDKILFIEDVGERLYRFDRMMYQLKLAGVLKNLAGLVVGALTEMEDQNPTFGQTAEEIIYEVIKEYSYPVCFGFPAGHIENNQPLILGRQTELCITNESVLLTIQ